MGLHTVDMVCLISSLALADCALYHFFVLLQVYQYTPVRELKRLARKGDDVASLLYKAVAYGTSLKVLLRGAAIVSGALALVSFTAATNIWLALLIMLIVAGLAASCLYRAAT